VAATHHLNIIRFRWSGVYKYFESSRPDEERSIPCNEHPVCYSSLFLIGVIDRSRSDGITAPHLCAVVRRMISVIIGWCVVTLSFSDKTNPYLDTARLHRIDAQSTPILIATNLLVTTILSQDVSACMVQHCTLLTYIWHNVVMRKFLTPCVRFGHIQNWWRCIIKYVKWPAVTADPSGITGVDHFFVVHHVDAGLHDRIACRDIRDIQCCIAMFIRYRPKPWYYNWHGMCRNSSIYLHYVGLHLLNKWSTVRCVVNCSSFFDWPSPWSNSQSLQVLCTSLKTSQHCTVKSAASDGLTVRFFHDGKVCFGARGSIDNLTVWQRS
jgi:hypothetical protein